MRPGVLDCGCLWDGQVLSMSDCGINPNDHGLGPVASFRRGRPADLPDEWPDPDSRWLGADDPGSGDTPR